MSAALHAYALALEPARRRVAEGEELGRLLAANTDPGQLHAFLIQWASLSLQLQEPIELFLGEASRRCAELGETKLALTLLYVALDAIDLYRLLAEDTRGLAQLWNGRRLPHLDMTSLLTQPSTQAIRNCHEQQRLLVIGASPWAQLAAVFELSTLLAAVADRTLAQAKRLLGDEARLGSLHSRTQPRCSQLLSKAMDECLAASVDRHSIMVEAGERSLELYGEFLLECSVAGFNLSSWQARRCATSSG
ncbi:MAG TPA: hypothetical protein VM869_12655 [Enhygromyxa sp.]|nr:hypothetical protein [Enhygromyxa sp.]